MKMWVPYHSVCPSVCPQFFVDTALAKVFKLPYPNWAWRLPMRCAWAWNFGSVTFALGARTFDLGARTLTLEILWMLLCPSY